MSDIELMRTAEVAKLKVLYRGKPEKLRNIYYDAADTLNTCEKELKAAQASFDAAKSYHDTWSPIWDRTLEELQDEPTP